MGNFITKNEEIKKLIGYINQKDLEGFKTCFESSGISPNRNISIPFWRSKMIYRFLDIAVYRDSYEIAEFLLDNGAELEQKRALYYVVMNNNINMVKLLCKHNIEPDSHLPFGDNKEWITPLEYSRKTNKTEIAKFLDNYERNFV